MSNDFQRAALARAVALPLTGTIEPRSLRQGPGWAEGCATQENGVPVWRRFVEKNGRVYQTLMWSNGGYESVHALIEKFLDTMAVPGEYSSPSQGDYDVLTDVSADRDSSIKKATQFLGAGREAIAKALPGKPFDAAKPAAWIYQNGDKYETRAKESLGTAAEHSTFSGADRACLVRIIGESGDQYAGALQHTGAAQYVWQYFGGEAPLWLKIGLAAYGQQIAGGGGKGKLSPETLTRTKGAIASGKRRLDQWFDVATTNEITDNEQGSLELAAWQAYFKTGRGAKKYKKQYEAYVQTLRDTGDPTAARKAFDGVNYDEMLQDFKAWGADLK
jgi:hypothetical protein